MPGLLSSKLTTLVNNVVNFKEYSTKLQQMFDGITKISEVNIMKKTANIQCQKNLDELYRQLFALQVKSTDLPEHFWTASFLFKLEKNRDPRYRKIIAPMVRGKGPKTLFEMYEFAKSVAIDFE